MAEKKKQAIKRARWSKKARQSQAKSTKPLKEQAPIGQIKVDQNDWTVQVNLKHVLVGLGVVLGFGAVIGGGAWWYHQTHNLAHQLPGQVITMTPRPGSLFAKEVGKANAKKSSYFVLGDNNNQVAVAQSKKQAQQWQGSDSEIKKNAKQSLHYSVKGSTVRIYTQAKADTQMEYLHGENVRITSSHHLKGKWYVSVMGAKQSLADKVVMDLMQ